MTKSIVSVKNDTGTAVALTISSKKYVTFAGADVSGTEPDSFNRLLPVSNNAASGANANQDWASNGTLTFKSYLDYGSDNYRQDTVTPAQTGENAVYAAVHIAGSVNSSSQGNGKTYDLTITVPANCVLAVLGADTNNASNYHIVTLTSNAYTVYSDKDLTQTEASLDFYVWADGTALTGNTTVSGSIQIAFAEHA